jgi:hypothetical protein
MTERLMPSIASHAVEERALIPVEEDRPVLHCRCVAVERRPSDRRHRLRCIVSPRWGMVSRLGNNRARGACASHADWDSGPRTGRCGGQVRDRRRHRADHGGWRGLGNPIVTPLLESRTNHVGPQDTACHACSPAGDGQPVFLTTESPRTQRERESMTTERRGAQPVLSLWSLRLSG